MVVVKIRKLDKKMVFVMKLMFRMEARTVSLLTCYTEINEELIKSGTSYTNYILNYGNCSCYNTVFKSYFATYKLKYVDLTVISDKLFLIER